MNIREFYNALEENYDEVLTRLMVESRIVKYVSKFKNDGSFNNLRNNLAEENYPEAFRAVHTLKGIAQNLGFHKLYLVSSRLTEKLRADEYDNLQPLFEDIEKEYNRIIEATGLIE